MRNSIHIGKLFGIELRVDYSWFVIFFLLTAILSLQYFPTHRDWAASTCWTLGFITSILFFSSVIAHELAHSIVSQRNDIPVKSITLFIFGGVARITKEMTQPSVEFKIAIAGPLCSLGLGALFYGLWFATQTVSPPLAVMFSYLSLINVALAIFNMLPGFPLDGGRVFRSGVWWLTKSYERATRIAYISGRVMAYSFIVGGFIVMFLFSAFWLNGLWFIFIGFILDMAARGSYRQSKLRAALKPWTAGELMLREWVSISPGLSLRELVENYLLGVGHRYFLVTEDGELKGTVTLEDVKKIPPERRGLTTVAQVMTPAGKVATAFPSDDAATVLEMMEGKDAEHMPVLYGGKVVGIIVREELWRFAQIHAGY